MFGVLRPSTPEQEQMPISPGASPPPPRSLAPMPPSEFDSREDLLAGCKDWAAHQGFAVVIARSRFNRLWLKCDRGGTYENRRNLTPEQRKRKRGESRLLGCQFKMLANVKRDGVWKVETEVAEHNHGPSEDMSAHPTLRRMTDEQVNKVNEMCDIGRSPAETLEELKALWPDIKVLTRDIYNARKKYKTQKELAEQASGQPQEQPFEDPNGLFPGPSANGRWAWLEDGDEVMSKKSKKRKRTTPATAPATPNSVNSALDPQLNTPGTSHALHHQPVLETGRQLLNDFNQNHPQPAHLGNNSQPRHGGYNSVQNTYSRHPAPNDHFPSSFHQNTVTEPRTLTPYPPTHQPNNPPPSSRLRSQRLTNAPTAPMSGTSSDAPAISVLGGGGAPAPGAPPKMQSGHVIMSRIERMEKEQRDQKSMLEQILGAVRGGSVRAISD